MRSFSLASGFLSDLSHELRTPLSGIIGFAALMHEGKLGPLSADQLECLGDILTSAQQLLTLINDVSDLARIEAGTLEIHPEAVDLAALIDEVRESLATLAAQKRVQITSAVQPEARAVTADPARLKHVVYHCLATALKSTPEGRRVVVRVTGEEADRVRIEVEAPGGRPQDQGAGPGLTLARRIVEVQGGRLEIRATGERGGVIVAVVPRHP